MKIKSLFTLLALSILVVSCTEEKPEESKPAVVDEYPEPKTACECVDMQVESLKSGDYHTEVFGVCETLLTGKTEDEQVAIHEAYEACPNYKILEAEFGSIVQDPGTEFSMEVNQDPLPMDLSTLKEAK